MIIEDKTSLIWIDQYVFNEWSLSDKD